MPDLEQTLWVEYRRNQLVIKNIERVLLGFCTTSGGAYLYFSKALVTSCTSLYAQLGVMLVGFALWLPLAWIKATATAHLESFERNKTALPPKADG
ncbi:hypothetical protein HDN1F_35450 [gamma proteobacterium HdN1]|nr:hypothetical protein HDN1F_35450 [gamma proteobacterium HdN1]